MNGETTVFKGVVRGRTIELDHAPDLPDGEQVNVTVQSAERRQELATGEGLRRALGGWADEAAEVDQFLDWNREQRKRNRVEPEP